MKTNKKRTLGVFISIVLAVAIMQGAALKNQKKSFTIQQGTIASAYMAAGGTSGGTLGQTSWGFLTAAMLETTTAITGVCVAAGPVGWGVLGVYAL